jgi:hypothetical protein
MFALAALICFVLVVFGVDADFSIEALGLAFLALHALIGGWPFADGWPRRRQ